MQFQIGDIVHIDHDDYDENELWKVICLSRDRADLENEFGESMWDIPFDHLTLVAEEGEDIGFLPGDPVKITGRLPSWMEFPEEKYNCLYTVSFVHYPYELTITDITISSEKESNILFNLGDYDQLEISPDKCSLYDFQNNKEFMDYAQKAQWNWRIES